jgi:hypothetical protein
MFSKGLRTACGNAKKDEQMAVVDECGVTVNR